MKKRIGVLFCALLAMVALTLSFALPASAADDTFVIGVYYYDADGNSIKTNQYLGELPEYFGGSLTHAQQVIDDIHTHAPLFNAARTEIRLFADVPTALTIPANTTTTLNLNGFTLSAADGTAPLTVAEGGALTITDTSENKTGKIAYTGSAAVSAIENHGRLTIETANVSTASSTAALISNSGETARIAVKGGNFDTNGAGNFANGAGARIAVSGGSFTEAVAAEYCAAGCEPLTVAAGKYTVQASAYDDRFGEMLTVVGQAAVTEGGTSYYPIDVVCGIDALSYKAVGVEYRVIRTGASPLDTTGTKETDKVYTAVSLTTAANVQSVCKPTDLGAAYLYTARLLFDTSAYTEADTVVRITPYAVGLDGVTVYRGRTVELDGDICAASGVTLFAKGE